ncbi:hypothetical protein M422DRAFT_239356 [Sphaerobolus stellatus SS14]|nr:hypothetical protein M422DRAFT_239356 [Sphaerobolus stellatus SS14]
MEPHVVCNWSCLDNRRDGLWVVLNILAEVIGAIRVSSSRCYILRRRPFTTKCAPNRRGYEHTSPPHAKTPISKDGIYIKRSNAIIPRFSLQFKRLNTLIVSALYDDMMYNILQQLHSPAVQYVTLRYWNRRDPPQEFQGYWPNLETLRLDFMHFGNGSAKSSEYLRRYFNISTLRILHLSGSVIPQINSTLLSGDPTFCPQLRMLVIQESFEPITESLKKLIQDRLILRGSQENEVPFRVGLSQQTFRSITWPGSPFLEEPFIKAITDE